jgi:hypothetical protein
MCLQACQNANLSMPGNDFPGIGFAYKVATYKYLSLYVSIDLFQVVDGVRKTQNAKRLTFNANSVYWPCFVRRRLTCDAGDRSLAIA